MSSLLPRLLLPALCVCVFACSDDAGENLSEGGFATGEQTSGGQSTTPATSNTTTGPTTTPTTPTSDPTTDPTTEPTTTGTDASTTASTDPATTNPTDPSDTTDPSTTDPTDPTDTTDETTGPPAACDNETIDDDEVCFVLGDTVATGATPSDIASGDFDGDGSFDVIVTSVGGGNVAVHLGDGTGGLGAADNTPVGANPTRVVAGEFTGDANWDALTANTDAGTVSVLVADGAGGFTQTAITVGGQPVDLGLGDLDGANGLDFAVANAGDANYQTAINDGVGGFTLFGPWTPSGEVVEMTGIALGSVAINGTVDAFYGGGEFYAATNGGGDGTMVAGQSQGGAAGTNLARFNPGDLDGNADVDIGATDGALARLYAGQGADGSAAFMSATLGPHVNVSEVVIADVTGEGTGDVIVADEGANEVIVYVGFGDLTFDDGTTFAVGAAPSGVAIADLNEDGVNDIILSNRGGGDLTILLSNP